MSKESWPKYLVRLAKSALVVRFASIAPKSIESQAQRLSVMGLGEGDKMGYVSILRKGLERAACLNTARENNGGWRRSSWSIHSEGLGRLAKRITKKPKR